MCGLASERGLARYVNWMGWGSPENHQDGMRAVLAKLMETQIWHPPAPEGYVGEVFNKGTMAPASMLVLDRAAPLALMLKPDNLVQPHMALLLFEFLCLPWSFE